MAPAPSTPGGFIAQMNDQAGTAYGDHSTEQGASNPGCQSDSERLARTEAAGMSEDERAGMNRARGLEEPLTENWSKQQRELWQSHLRTVSSQLARGPAFPSAWGPSWEGHPGAFPGISCPFAGTTQPRMAFPALCLGFILPFLSPVGHILPFWENAPGSPEGGVGISS